MQRNWPLHTTLPVCASHVISIHSLPLTLHHQIESLTGLPPPSHRFTEEGGKWGCRRGERRGKVKDGAPSPAWPPQRSSIQPLAPPNPVLPPPQGRGEEKERRERQGGVVEARILFLGDTAGSRAGKMSLDLFPLVVISTTTITEIHHSLSGSGGRRGFVFLLVWTESSLFSACLGRLRARGAQPGPGKGTGAKRQWGPRNPSGPLTLDKPPRFALLRNGEKRPARREGGRQHEAALGVEGNE